MKPITRLFSLVISAAIIIFAIPVLFGIGVIALGFVLVTSLVAAIVARFMIKRDPNLAKRWNPRAERGPIIDHE